MLKNKPQYLVVFFLFAILVSCAEKQQSDGLLEKQISDIKKVYAPDKRVALFDISADKREDTFVLQGESNLPHAVNALKNKLEGENIAFVDSIQPLPSANLAGKVYALVNNSVANIRSNPKHSGELATQATLGTPLNVLKKEGDWLLVQTPDKYISWVDDGGVVSLTEEELNTWRKNDKIIYTKTQGYSYTFSDKEQVVSDLVAGSVLNVIKYANGYYIVRYPDGRSAFVAMDEAEPYSNWLEKMNPNEESLVETGKELMGLPYLWGGTSTKGVDCSGYTKTIYFLNGMIIPRDASQQVHTGKPIDSVANFENLKKGDLLFFGRKATDSTAERVVHVGMWIGNNEFIHASNQVRVSSMDSEAENFDEWNLNRYLRTKRILKEEGDALINLTQTPLFKD